MPPSMPATMLTSWKPGASPPAAPARSCWPAKPSRKPISANRTPGDPWPKNAPEPAEGCPGLFLPWMFPRVLDGDLLLYSRISKDLHSDDILVYDVGGKVYVGRMKARGGEVVDISETGEFLINGAVQAEEIFYPTEKDVDSDIEYPLTVREGYYFILSDFRTNCEDSRILGDVSEENIKGKVISMFRRRGF